MDSADDASWQSDSFKTGLGTPGIAGVQAFQPTVSNAAVVNAQSLPTSVVNSIAAGSNQSAGSSGASEPSSSSDAIYNPSGALYNPVGLDQAYGVSDNSQVVGGGDTSSSDLGSLLSGISNSGQAVANTVTSGSLLDADYQTQTQSLINQLVNQLSAGGQSGGSSSSAGGAATQQQPASGTVDRTISAATATPQAQQQTQSPNMSAALEAALANEPAGTTINAEGGFQFPNPTTTPPVTPQGPLVPFNPADYIPASNPGVGNPILTQTSPSNANAYYNAVNQLYSSLDQQNAAYNAAQNPTQTAIQSALQQPVQQQAAPAAKTTTTAPTVSHAGVGGLNNTGTLGLGPGLTDLPNNNGPTTTPQQNTGDSLGGANASTAGNASYQVVNGQLVLVPNTGDTQMFAPPDTSQPQPTDQTAIDNQNYTVDTTGFGP